jgi:hypothetical protein
MTNQHRATPEQLEASQQVPVISSAADRMLALQNQIRDGALSLADAFKEINSEPEPADDARRLTLVERVADAIGTADDEGLTNMTWSNHSRAAIRAVVEWLRSEYPQREGFGTAWANLLDNEANR